MIKYTDLRIGNHVLGTTDNDQLVPAVIILLGNDSPQYESWGGGTSKVYIPFDTYYQKYNYLHPIYLDEKVFKAIDAHPFNLPGVYELRTNNRTFLLRPANERSYKLSQVYEGVEIPLAGIVGLHNLENLIYDLTGEELAVDFEKLGLVY